MNPASVDLEQRIDDQVDVPMVQREAVRPRNLITTLHDKVMPGSELRRLEHRMNDQATALPTHGQS